MNRPRPFHLFAAVALAGTLALTGCSSSSGDQPERPADRGAGEAAGGDGAAGGAASCVAGLTYQGTFYLQVDSAAGEQADALEGAEIPPCNDTGGADEGALPIDAYAIEGVDVRYAVVAEGGAGPSVYVAQEYAPGLSDARPLPDDVAATLDLG